MTMSHSYFDKLMSSNKLHLVKGHRWTAKSLTN